MAQTRPAPHEREAGVVAAANTQYADKATCVTACKTWPAGTAGATGGNSLGCHEYHRSVAAQSAGNAPTHCPHTGPTGGGVCS